MADGFTVDLGSLRAAARGVRGTVDQAEVRNLEPIGPAAGHDGLARALDGFLARWRDGVAALTEDAGRIAGHLEADERAYRAVEAHGTDLLSRPGPDPATG